MESNDFLSTVENLVIINHIEKIKLDKVALKKKVGEGGQAKVYLGVFGDKKIAAKVFQNVDYKCFAHELVILAYLEHPNIPKFYGIISENNVLSLVFEFIEGKTLDELDPKTFSTELKYQMIYELASCLTYIHSKKFIHRDLKPENLMLSNEGHLKLIDFGISKVITNEDWTVTRAKGTINYLSPECLDPADDDDDDDKAQQQIVSTITNKVDVWAFGGIVSWLFSGYVPWTPKYKDQKPIIQQVLFEKKEFFIPDNIKDEKIIHIIKMATVIDVNKRSEMKDILEYIEKNLHVKK